MYRHGGAVHRIGELALAARTRCASILDVVPKIRSEVMAHLRQHGAISRRLARELGVTDAALRCAVERGEFVRHRTSSYASAATEVDRLQTIRQDLSAMGTFAVACRRTALWLHDREQTIVPFRRQILVPNLNGPLREEPPKVHRTRCLEEVDVVEVANILTTGVARTVIDLMQGLDYAERLDLIDRLIVRRLVTRGFLYARAVALEHGRPGVATILEVTAPGAEDLFFSRLERNGKPLLLKAGLHDVQTNVVPRRAPAAGRCDAVSESARLVVEWDGLRFHSGPDARQRDNDKQNALVGRYHVLRFTWRDQLEAHEHVVGTTARVISRL